MALFAESGPFVLGPDDGPRVLLFHGLTGSPVELWPLGCALAAAGYRVEAPLWAGHGTTPADLGRVTAQDLVAQAIREVERVRPFAIAGLSMGALLAVIGASEWKSLQALVLLAPSVRLAGSNAIFDRASQIRALRKSSMLLRKRPPAPISPCDAVPAQSSDVRKRAAEAACDAECVFVQGSRYEQIPLRWAFELQALRNEAKRRAPHVEAPVLLLHGQLDRSALPASSLLAARWFRQEARVRFFSRSPHVLTLGPERAMVAAEIVDFLEQRKTTYRAMQSA